MKKLSSIVMVAAVVCMMQACGGEKDSTAAADSVNAVKDSTTSGQTGIAVVADDAKFAVDAGNGGMTEVELSKLAEQKATNAKVKEFATMMVMDHSKANAEMMALAKMKNITLPDSINEDSKKVWADLSKKSGSEFDKAYVDVMVKDHDKTVSMFEDASKNVKDADLKAFVDKTLPTLKSHQAHIKAIHDGMK